MHSQTPNYGACAPSSPSSTPLDDCCIEGSNFTPSCVPDCRKMCHGKWSRNDLERHTDLALHGLNEAESDKPTTSLLFRRLKHLMHCLLGAVPGFGLLPDLWKAVLDLRKLAQQDPRGAVGYIIVRIPGHDPNTAVTVRFELTDDAPDAY